MRGFFLTWVVNIAAIIVVINMVPGIHSEGRLATVLAALALGLINATLRPIVFALTLPLTVLSLGVFTLFMNAAFFYLASWLVEGFVVADFWAAFWGALCFSIVSFILNLLVSPQGRFRVYRFDDRRDPPPSSGSGPDIIDVDAEIDDEQEEDNGSK